MKKIILFGLLLVSGTIVKAQIQFGIKGGVNVSSPFTPIAMDKVARSDYNLTPVQNDSLNPNYQPNIGFQFGVTTNILLTKKGFHSKKSRKLRYLSFDPEALVSFESYTIKDLGNVNITYINVPAMLKLSFGKKFFVELGPYVNFLLTQSITGPHTEAIVHQSSSEIGGSTGIGYFFQPLHLGINLRTNVGSNLGNSPAGHSVNINSQLSIFYMFGKPKP